MSTINKIMSLLKEQGKTQKDLTDYLGISKNTFTDWKSGRVKSYHKFLPQIADFLGVSVDYLLGITEIKKGVVPTEQPLTPIKEEAINIILDLPDSAVEDWIRFLDAYRNKNDQ